MLAAPESNSLACAKPEATTNTPQRQGACGNTRDKNSGDLKADYPGCHW